MLTRDGRSQAIVIEEALENMPLPPQEITHAERVARVMAILKRVDRDRIPSMEEFDRREYDENGNPR